MQNFESTLRTLYFSLHLLYSSIYIYITNSNFKLCITYVIKYKKRGKILCCFILKNADVNICLTKHKRCVMLSYETKAFELLNFNLKKFNRKLAMHLFSKSPQSKRQQILRLLLNGRNSVSFNQKRLRCHLYCLAWHCFVVEVKLA